MRMVKEYKQNKKSELKFVDKLKKVENRKVGLKKLFEKYDGNYEKIDLNWNNIIGKEIL